jgi:VIT1/CCC1 family predicted Fe2+/Mn2+ transporter
MSFRTHREFHRPSQVAKLNWLRAAVLGANDGIVSVAGLVVGVASSGAPSSAIATAGLAGIAAGALSMAVGEYVSVSSSRDTEMALLEKERVELEETPEAELFELASIYERKGLTKATAEQVAKELTEHDPFAAHAEAELHIDPGNLADPWHAAGASAASFLSGAIIPLAAILVPPDGLRIPVAFVAVLLALAVTGVLSARAGDAPVARAAMRVVLGGALAMAVTYAVGALFDASGV